MAQSDETGSPADRIFEWFGSERRRNLFVGVIIGAGILFRLVAYLHNRSLWLDEAMLSCSVMRRSFLELLEPTLDFNQTAPVGFLYLVRTATVMFGTSEYALRLVPLLAGLAALPLFYVLITRYLDKGAALLGLSLFAVSEGLIYHSHEMKQYSTDVLLTILALLAVEPVLRGSAKPRHWALLGATGAVGLWFSHPLLFVLAAAGMVLAGSALYKKDWKRLAKLSAVGLAWMASFGLNYMLITRHVAANQLKLVAYSEQFMPLSFSLETLDWLRGAFADIAERALRLPTKMGCAVIASVCLLIGMVRLFARDKVRGFVLFLPLVLCVVASAMHKYPLKGRLMLFLAPMVLIFMGLGAQWFVASGRHRAIRLFGIAMLSVLVLVPTGSAVYHAFTSYAEEESRPVLQYVLEHKKPGDVIFLNEDAYPAFAYYCEAYDYEPGEHVRSSKINQDPGPYRSPVVRLLHEKGPRMWFIFSHHEGGPRERVLDTLKQVATQLDSFEVRRAGAYLYRLEASTGDETGEPENNDSRQ